MNTFTSHPGILAALLIGALSVSTAAAAAPAATEDPCLDALRSGSTDADRVCSDLIAGLRYEGSTGRMNTALPAALNNRAMARMKAGDLEGAAADLTEALELAPGAWAIYLNRANLALLNGDPAAAQDDLARVWELAPAASAAIYAADRNSVLAWRMLGNLNAAEAQLAATRAAGNPTARAIDELRSAPAAPEAPGRPPG